MVYKCMWIRCRCMWSTCRCRCNMVMLLIESIRISMINCVNLNWEGSGFFLCSKNHKNPFYLIQTHMKHCIAVQIIVTMKTFRPDQHQHRYVQYILHMHNLMYLTYENNNIQISVVNIHMHIQIMMQLQRKNNNY